MGKSNDSSKVSHFECDSQECPDIRAAAQWAWKCLENLAAVYCEYYCDRITCSTPAGTIEKLTKYRMANSTQEIKEQWEKAQREFHEALTYFSELTALADACPACAVAESFSCFPLFVQHSPRPPVATVKKNAVDCYPDVVFCGGDQRASFPCVIIETMITDFETETVERLRESALLALDVSDLPPMPPNDLQKLKMKLTPGQTIVKALNYIRNNAPSAEELEAHQFKEHFPLAIASAVALRDLIRILHYYPDAIDQGRSRALHEELVEFLEGAMAGGCISPAMVLYARPKYGDYSAEANLSVVLSFLLIQHPEQDIGDQSPENIEKAKRAIIQECVEQTSGRLREVVDELLRTKMYRCQIPRPADDLSFAEKGRFVQMLDLYWKLCKKVIGYQVDAELYAPNAILPLMTNLRQRVDICFSELGSLEGLVDAQEGFSALIETCMSPDWDDLQVARKWTQEMIHKMDTFLTDTNATVKHREYFLTDAERLFIEHAHRELDKLHAFTDKKWKSMVARGKMAERQVNTETDATPSRLAKEYPKDKIVLERREVDNKIHWYVNGVDKGLISVRSNTIQAKIIEILHDQISRGWVPHKTFMNACAWNEEEYFRSLDNPGRMQRQLTDIRNFLGVGIEFCKGKGVRFAENVVKSR